RSATPAVDEALTHIIRHAYQGQRGRLIQLSCRCLGPAAPGRPQAQLEFVLVDRGRGVDPAALRGRPLDEVRPGGLGSHFIRVIMNEIEYERRGDCNRLRLVKYLTKQKSSETSGGG